MLDYDLAELYGITTKRLKEQVRRNLERFPSDFMFELSAEEKTEVVANCDHLSNLKFSPYLPYAFTEHRILMLANIVNSPRAVRVSIQIVRTFIRMRAILSSNIELTHKLEQLEKKYDEQFEAVVEALRQLLTPPDPPKKPIGFHVEEPTARYYAKRKK